MTRLSMALAVLLLTCGSVSAEMPIPDPTQGLTGVTMEQAIEMATDALNGRKYEVRDLENRETGEVIMKVFRPGLADLESIVFFIPIEGGVGIAGYHSQNKKAWTDMSGNKQARHYFEKAWEDLAEAVCAQGGGAWMNNKKGQPEVVCKGGAS